MTGCSGLRKVELPMAAGVIIAGCALPRSFVSAWRRSRPRLVRGGWANSSSAASRASTTAGARRGAVPAALLALARTGAGVRGEKARGAEMRLQRRVEQCQLARCQLRLRVCVCGCAFTYRATACAPPRSSHIVIGAKNFTEQVVLGELLAQEIEARAGRRSSGGSGWREAIWPAGADF